MNRLALAVATILTSAGLVPAQKIEWCHEDYPTALAKAGEKAWPVLMVYCWVKGDPNCASMFSGTLADDNVNKALADLLCMGALDDDKGGAVWKRFGVGQVPTILFLTAKGEPIDVVEGYVPVAPFLKEVERIRCGKDTIPTLRKQLHDGNADLAAQLRLVNKLHACGDTAAALQVVEGMLKADEKAKDPATAEAMLLKITVETFADGVAPADYDLDPLRRFLKGQRNKAVLFRGYDAMAQAEFRRADLKESARWALKAWKNIPDDEVVPWGRNIQNVVYLRRKEFEQADKGVFKKALPISKAVLKTIQQQKPDKAFLANAMWGHACILFVNKKRKDALSLMQEAIALDPENKDLETVYQYWLQGNN